MRKTLRVFVDSDVIVSSIISLSGAAYFLLNQRNLLLFSSNYSRQEIKLVAEELGLRSSDIEDTFKERLKIVVLGEGLKKIKNDFADYVYDVNDAHIVAGAVESGVKFLISYNIRHYKTDKIKTDFNIIILTPALFLQYLRSL